MISLMMMIPFSDSSNSNRFLTKLYVKGCKLGYRTIKGYHKTFHVRSLALFYLGFYRCLYVPISCRFFLSFTNRFNFGVSAGNTSSNVWSSGDSKMFDP